MAGDANTVILSLGKSDIVCNKKDLIRKSKYFEAMFCHNFIEKNSDKVIMKEIIPETFISLLNYNGGTLDNPLEVLEVACMLHFEKEQFDLECSIISQYLSIETCLDVMFKSKRLQRSDLYKISSSLALYEFDKVNHTSNFLKLDACHVFEYLDNPGLNVSCCEIDIFYAILRWVDYDWKERKIHLLTLIKSIRFKDISAVDLGIILSHPTVKESQTTLQFLNCMLRYLGHTSCIATNLDLLCEAKNEIEINCTALSNSYRSVPTVPCIAGHLAKQHNLFSVKTKSPHLIEWNNNCLSSAVYLSKLDESESEIYGYKIISIGFKIYIIGGEYKYGYGKWNMDIWIYNTLFGNWVHQARLPSACRNTLICHLDAYLYFIGGVGKHRVIIDTVSRFSLDNNNWQECCKLTDCASILCCCSFNHKIYIFCSRIRYYCPLKNKLTTLAVHLPEKTGCTSALPYNKWIYIIGTTSAAVYRFEPLAAAPVMEYITKFQVASKNSCISNDKIYHFSDNDGNQLIETFDLINNDLGSFEIKNPDVTFSVSSGCFTVPKY